jgi:hypothetical protein
MHAIRSFVAMVATHAFALGASAQIPEAKVLLATVGLDASQVEQVMAGEIVRGAIKAASERELVAAMAFMVKTTPADLVAGIKQGLGNQVDPEMIAFGPTTGAAADFAKLDFGKDADERAKEYVKAEPGGSLNLSAEEMAAFNKLGDATYPAVLSAVRNQLAARVRDYQQKGLAGIAPYALDGGKQRSPAEELRTATNASKALKQYVPSAFQYLNGYPAGKPAGTDEQFRWTHFQAHGTPTIALQHLVYVPDGKAYLVVQRMFYVSTGFNAEQALLALLPVEGGTVVVYGNRTSTDQVTGFGGGTKRSIGSKLLESQLEGIFEKARGKVAN